MGARTVLSTAVKKDCYLPPPAVETKTMPDTNPLPPSARKRITHRAMADNPNSNSYSLPLPLPQRETQTIGNGCNLIPGRNKNK